MPIRVECESCGKRLRVKEERAGQRLKCPDCGERIDVPDLEYDEDDYYEDEYEEPRPRRKKRPTRKPASRPQKQKKPPVPLIAAVAGGGGLLLIVLITVVLKFMAGGGAGPGGVSEETAATGGEAAVPEGYESRLNIPLGTSFGEAYFPPGLPYAVTAASRPTTIWNLKDGQQVGSADTRFVATAAPAISSDGSQIAVYANKERQIEVWSFKDGSLIKAHPLKGPSPLFMAFLNNDHLLIGRHFAKWTVAVLEVATGVTVSEFESESLSGNVVSALSADGSRYAGCVYGKLCVFDVATGKQHQPEKFSVEGVWDVGWESIGFSPDGSTVAAVASKANRQLIVGFWDVETGELTGKCDHIFGDLRFPLAEPVRWTSDGSACLALGRVLVDREHAIPLWSLQVTKTPSVRTGLVDDETLAIVNQGVNKTITTIPLPWERIRGTMATMQDSASCWLHPGATVAVKVEADVRSGNKFDTQRELENAFTSILEARQLTVKATAAATLKIEYSEEAGDNLEVVEVDSAFDRTGRSTGRTVSGTSGICRMTWRAEGQEEPLWTKLLEVDSNNMIMRTGVSDASVRKHMFEYLVRRVDEVAMPMVIPRDSNLPHLPLKAEYVGGR